MARYIGIDIGTTHVRAVALATGYKRVVIEAMQEVAIAGVESLERAIAQCAEGLLPHTDGVAVAVDGDGAFMHRLSLPLTAAKQLEEVLPFELEAQVPVDMAELVYGYRVLERVPGDATIEVMAALARRERVRERIDLVRGAIGREPERVGCGPLVLGNLSLLMPALRTPEPVALLDLGSQRTEVTILVKGEPVFARTLSRGVAALPDAASALTAELRQTLLAFVSNHPAPVSALVLVGGGAGAEGADRYLATQLGVPVLPLPAIEAELSGPELVLALPRFAKALGLAVGLGGKAVDVNLRSGELAYQRGFGFLKEKAPILAGLVLATAVSFLFATWAELRALDRDRTLLGQALLAETKKTLGEETTDAERVHELLDKVKGRDEVDPMPHMDAFDVVVELSKVIPDSITHDVDELDMQRGHVKLSGIVGTTADAQLISGKMAENPCVSEAKIAKLTQVVNSDRQKYVLEFDIKCPEDAGAKKRPAASPKAEEKP